MEVAPIPRRGRPRGPGSGGQRERFVPVRKWGSRKVMYEDSEDYQPQVRSIDISKKNFKPTFSLDATCSFRKVVVPKKVDAIPCYIGATVNLEQERALITAINRDPYEKTPSPSPPPPPIKKIKKSSKDKKSSPPKKKSPSSPPPKKEKSPPKKRGRKPLLNKAPVVKSPPKKRGRKPKKTGETPSRQSSFCYKPRPPKTPVIISSASEDEEDPKSFSSPIPMEVSQFEQFHTPAQSPIISRENPSTPEKNSQSQESQEDLFTPTPPPSASNKSPPSSPIISPRGSQSSESSEDSSKSPIISPKVTVALSENKKNKKVKRSIIDDDSSFDWSELDSLLSSKETLEKSKTPKSPKTKTNEKEEEKEKDCVSESSFDWSDIGD